MICVADNSRASAALAGEVQSLLAPGTLVQADAPLARRTTLRVGGPADCYVEPVDEAELARLIRFCRARQVEFMMIGRGSNLLIRDGGIRGVVISLAGASFARIGARPGGLACGAGAKLKDVAMTARREGIGGLEFMDGIPATVGGALRMNAGAMGRWTFAALESLRYLDYSGQVHEVAAAQVPVSYRECPLLKTAVALGAVFVGPPATRAEIDTRLQECSQKRWTSQPKESSAGCIFKNPVAIAAGRLVDELGLKNTRVGGAVVSEVHGNFMVNDGHATARDVLALIEVVRARVREARGLELETEVEIVGED